MIEHHPCLRVGMTMIVLSSEKDISSLMKSPVQGQLPPAGNTVMCCLPPHTQHFFDVELRFPQRETGTAAKVTIPQLGLL